MPAYRHYLPGLWRWSTDQRCRLLVEPSRSLLEDEDATKGRTSASTDPPRVLCVQINESRVPVPFDRDRAIQVPSR